jgi:hypothetical protein
MPSLTPRAPVPGDTVGPYRLEVELGNGGMGQVFRKRHVLYDGGHRNLVTRPDLIGEILDWLDRYLGPAQPK